MSKMSEPGEKLVSVEQLQPGVFIRLDAQWFTHPFLFSKFKIKNTNQIATLKKLGITEVVYVPERSDCLPLKKSAEMEAAQAAPRRPGPGEGKPLSEDPAVQFLWQIKQDRIAKLQEKHKNLKQCEKQYDETIRRVPAILQSIMTGTTESVLQAGELVQSMVQTFLGDTDAIVSLLSIKAKEESIYYHSLNVSVLALMLGKQAGLDRTMMHALGMGAMLHDIGKVRIAKKILRKRGPLTKAERELVELHTVYGGEIVQAAAGFPQEAADVVLQHHEMQDGSGYPQGLSGEAVAKLARIAAIANVYDNLCNPLDPEEAMTPYAALSHMYTKMQNLLDMEVFTLFIHCLGIYPPGTVVQLTNGMIGMVLSVNPKNPLKPSLMLYDPDVPRDQAIIFDMEDDTDVGVYKTLPLDKVPADARAYLNPGVRITYFPEQPSKKAG